MSRRVSLRDIGEQTAEKMDAAAAHSPTSETPALTTVPDAPELATDRDEATERKARSVPDEEPKTRFDQFERKEARVRLDQYGRLQALSRQLNRSRNRRGERITENTLIRVAIDLLLSRESELTGATEAELRGSVGL
jgi:hypothetical protein